MSAFGFSFQVVFPLFALMALGWLLKRLRFVDDAFVATATKLLFHVAIPALCFVSVMKSDLTETFDPTLLLLTVGVTVVFVVLLRLVVPRFLHDPYVYSAFIQGCFRGNTTIIGLPLVFNLAGAAGQARLAMLICFIGPLYNILAVLVLAEAAPAGGTQKHWRLILRDVVTNPLIIACVLGVVASLLQVRLPQVIDQPLNWLCEMAMPLSLIALGASISLRGEHAEIRRAGWAAAMKTAVFPALALLVAHLIGLRGVDLAVVLGIFGVPSSISGFPMAFQMGADHKLSSLCIVFSTVLCLATLFGYTCFLHGIGSI